MHRYLPMTEEDKREMLDAIVPEVPGNCFPTSPKKCGLKGITGSKKQNRKRRC